MDEQELEVERRKLELDERRVQVEERKASQGFWTRVTILVPVGAALVAAVIGGGVSLYTRHQDSRDKIELEQLQAQDAFELKSAELVMGGSDAFENFSRATAMKQLFPKRLPATFADRFDPEANTDFRFRVIASKKELLNLLAAHPAERKKIIATWRALFPGDEWAKSLE